MQKLIVIGSGISGIMTAWQAVQAGYSVELYSKSPDPRAAQAAYIEQEASTFDSKNDQRYITLFEGHPYLELEGYVNKVYPGIANDFQQNVLNGGILASSMDKFCQHSQAWLMQRAALNAQLLHNNEVEKTRVAELFHTYTRENRAAMEKWYEIFINFIGRSPDILNNLSLHASGILRLYDDPDVFKESLHAHQAEGVFIKKYTPQELVAQYPAYQEGVERGFIAGGAIEMHGITFAVGTFCRAMLNELEHQGAVLHFETEVKRILFNSNNEVEGITLFKDNQPRVAHHYAFHTGAFAGPELFEGISAAQHQLAAVEGYWITIENAHELVQGMGGKPNKVHGKKSLASLLNMIEKTSAMAYRDYFKKIGIKENQLGQIAPIVDFNNMPLYKNGKTFLGVGSGYIFKGLAQRKNNDKVTFINNIDSEQFVLKTMELWLEALHGKALMEKGKLIAHSIGCKRSFTPTDEELDINLRTTGGGICMIHDGGNTGSTTKSSFIASYIIEKMRLASHMLDQPSLKQVCLDIRRKMGKTKEEISSDRWHALSQTIRNIAWM